MSFCLHSSSCSLMGFGISTGETYSRTVSASAWTQCLRWNHRSHYSSPESTLGKYLGFENFAFSVSFSDIVNFCKHFICFQWFTLRSRSYILMSPRFVSFFCPEDGGSMFLRNACIYLARYHIPEDKYLYSHSCDNLKSQDNPPYRVIQSTKSY
jgi:hypothetical protein